MSLLECGGYESEGKGKRKQHCTYCKNHGKKSRKTNHKCDHEHCVCLLCKLTRLSRLIMRHQQRLWRHLKDSKRRQNAAAADATGAGAGGGAGEPAGGEHTTDSSGAANGTSSTKLQKCDMCRNHGEIMSKRAHKNACPYQDCLCELCSLTRKRRYIMRLQQRVRRSQVTSKQHNEVWEYVTKATAELESLGLQDIQQTTDDPNASSSSSDASSSPSPDSSSSSTSGGSLSLKPEVAPPNPVTPAAPAEIRSKDTASSPVPMDMPPLEPLPECSPTRYSPRPPAPPLTNVPPPAATSRTKTSCYPSPPPPNPLPPNRVVTNVPQMEIEPAWLNLKREREEFLKQNSRVQTREENLFGHLDFMKDHHHHHHHRTMTGRLEPPVPPEASRSFHSTAIPMNFGTSPIPPYKSLVPMIDTSHHPPPPLQKSRADCNLHFQYRSMLWGNLPAEPSVGFVPEEFQQHCYRSFLASNTDLRIQPPPGLIQIPQPQHPLRPRPLPPVRPHTLPVSVECDHVNLHYLAYFLQNQSRDTLSTLSTSRSFGLPREALFLHHPVP
ncbi:uncharacterized protein LOC135215234 isoform X2 [Macrobrachium nipponense]|uniref:uncharacterized protein LOC135215234 isoform X2 n=1 Tax=Macrobrachium nipponense TaxID=159736 RepID=UPI0030C85C6B